jgi:hypothetical protein
VWQFGFRRLDKEQMFCQTQMMLVIAIRTFSSPMVTMVVITASGTGVVRGGLLGSMRHPTATAHEMLKQEGDDHNERDRPIHSSTPQRTVCDYRSLRDPVNGDSEWEFHVQ